MAVQGAGMRHPTDMGVAEVEAFLTMMATERKASASTHNQALSALLFLYREVLNINLLWLNVASRLIWRTQTVAELLALEAV
jgi:hypothetical protein